MANIHINRARQSMGHFPPYEVAVGLKSGRFLPSDLAWTDGMETWKPLGEFSNLPEVEADEEISVLASQPTSIEPSSAWVEPAWERRAELGVRPAVMASIRDLFSSPVKVFSALPEKVRLLNPLLFLWLVGWVMWAIFLIYNLAFMLVNPGSLAQFGNFPLASLIVGYGFWILVVPVALTVFAFVSSFILHGCLWLFGAAKKPFATTFSVVCYSHSISAFLALIPLCGVYLVPVYQMVLWIIGLQKAHQIEAWRATLAVMVPMLLCCGALVWGIVEMVDVLSQNEVWKQMMEEIAKAKR